MSWRAVSGAQQGHLWEACGLDISKASSHVFWAGSPVSLLACRRADPVILLVRKELAAVPELKGCVSALSRGP